MAPAVAADPPVVHSPGALARALPFGRLDAALLAAGSIALCALAVWSPQVIRAGLARRRREDQAEDRSARRPWSAGAAPEPLGPPLVSTR